MDINPYSAPICDTKPQCIFAPLVIGSGITIMCGLWMLGRVSVIPATALGVGMLWCFLSWTGSQRFYPEKWKPLKLSDLAMVGLTCLFLTGLLLPTVSSSRRQSLQATTSIPSAPSSVSSVMPSSTMESDRDASSR